MTAPFTPYPRRPLMVAATVLATTIYAVDTSIANVALPQMQAALGASQDQIVWVVTSYMVAAAIATPLASWCASRFGRRRVFLLSVAGFTFASMACGLATDLYTAVLARAIQGAAGAGIMPLGQSAVLDVTHPRDHGKAMATIGLGTLFGPMVGPTLGGWLTDTFSWRWVYFINLPIGLLALAGLLAALPDARDPRPMRFDMFGFAIVSLFLGSFQLMMDRGQQLDWFEAPEIAFYAVLMGLSAWLVAIHVSTARDTYIRPRVFTDRNFALGCVMSLSVGVLTFATIPLTSVMIQHSLGYNAMQTGMISLPRSIGTLIAMLSIARFIGRVDARFFLIGGLLLNGLGLYMLAMIPPDVDRDHLLLAGLFQGFGSGMIFPPLSTLVFATLPPMLRNEGAALFALTRNMGTSLGISVLQSETIRNTGFVQARLAEGLRPDNPLLQWRMPDMDFTSAMQVATLSRQSLHQANMTAYVGSYWFTFVLAVAMVPVVALMRPPRSAAAPHRS